ncbi:pyridoxamine 5'-phosphate oxidase family protein [Jannaschia ovalis]|uniref:Pyridoxamine 5'-phosphate oxidase family protein n=1 Tax=Jannaschia ovalis TaxID=3038773 RepID=A0ABY8LCE6_9RHOB|nr:pyridoxamine 5'-phosphate oxidase family protein [Jannaschia sp. GRR-S6-38]WGH77720.1 pyridoxamine 5'-phosphate oxidase family protein [Jannaschia sp. GRR-S6-38]
MSDPWDALDTLLDHLWARLARGAADASDPFRFVALATAGAEGPEARMVGNRAADRAARRLEVHSDLRTAKVAALRRDPRATLLFWDAAAQLQLRVQLEMDLIPADPARWDRIPETPRLNYGTDPAPGTPVAAPETVTRTPDRARFVALSGRVRGMDAVSLAHDPHRRAHFAADGTGQWVAP